MTRLQGLRGVTVWTRPFWTKSCMCSLRLTGLLELGSLHKTTLQALTWPPGQHQCLCKHRQQTRDASCAGRGCW